MGQVFANPPIPICANLPPKLWTKMPPSPYPLPRGERALVSPSLDGRGNGEGDKQLKSPVHLS